MRKRDRSWWRDVGPLRVLLLDGAERGRGREERIDPVLGAHAPERPGVGRAHRLALVEDGGAALEERGVDDVGVPDHPADVRGRPVHLAGPDAVDALHAPLERDGVARAVADHALGLAGGARGVEDVEGVGGIDGHALDGRAAGGHLVPVEVASGPEGRLFLGPLKDHAPLRAVTGHLDRLVQERLVGHHAVHLDAARGGEDHSRAGVVDASGQLPGRESSEDDGVDGPDARAGEHPDDRLRHHGHVEDDPVALLDAELAEGSGKARDLVAQLGVRVGAHGAGDGAVVDEGALLAPPAVDVEVERVVAGVEPPAHEPPVEGRPRIVEHPVPPPFPVERLGRARPEPLRVLPRPLVDLIVCAAHAILLPGGTSALSAAPDRSGRAGPGTGVAPRSDTSRSRRGRRSGSG